jgi:hypothetical protein
MLSAIQILGVQVAEGNEGAPADQDQAGSTVKTR